MAVMTLSATASNQAIILGKGVALIRLDIEDTNGFFTIAQGNTKFGIGIFRWKRRRAVVFVVFYIIGENGLPFTRHPGEIRWVIQRQCVSDQILAAGTTACLVLDQPPVTMHGEEMNIQIIKAVMDQAGHVGHQCLELQRRTHALADFGDQSQLIGTTA